MKEFFKRLLQKFFDKLKALLERLFEGVISRLDEILKLMGFAGLGGFSFLAYKEAFDDTIDHFGIFARVLQIDDLFDKIDTAFGPSIYGVLNTNFTGVCSAFGIVTAINEILNSIAWSLIIFVALFVFKAFVNGMMAVVSVVTKV